MLQKNTLLELEYNLMLFRLGQTRSSSQIQERHIQRIDKTNKILKKINEMTAVSIKMKETLLKGEIKEFADLLHESWVLKTKINKEVTNSYVSECYNVAREIGALGGKLLGAGGSGYLLIYASPFFL